MQTNFLDASPLILEGIGERRRDALEQAGVRTIAEMLRRGPRRIMDAVREVPPAEVESWFAAALLLRVRRIDPDLAEILVDAEIRTVDALADADLERLEEVVTAAQERRRIARAPSVYDLAAIQREAGKLRRSGVVTGQVVDAESREPLPGVMIRAQGIGDSTDEGGRFRLLAVPEGWQRLDLRPPDRVPLSLRLHITRDALHPPLVLKLKAVGEGRPAREVHESKGEYIALRPGSVARHGERTLDQLPDPTYLLVGDPQRDGGVRLVHLYRGRIGRDVVTEVVSVVPASLPSGTSKGDVLTLQEGVLERTSLTLHDVARGKFEALIRRPLEIGARRRRKTVEGGSGAT
jgi:hypothetical protein